MKSLEDGDGERLGMERSCFIDASDLGYGDIKKGDSLVIYRIKGHDREVSEQLLAGQMGLCENVFKEINKLPYE